MAFALHICITFATNASKLAAITKLQCIGGFLCSLHALFSIYKFAPVTPNPLFLVSGGNPVLGYLLGGALVGPYATGLISDVHSIKHLAEMGVVLLLFNIGGSRAPFLTKAIPNPQSKIVSCLLVACWFRHPFLELSCVDDAWRTMAYVSLRLPHLACIHLACIEAPMYTPLHRISRPNALCYIHTLSFHTHGFHTRMQAWSSPWIDCSPWPSKSLAWAQRKSSYPCWV